MKKIIGLSVLLAFTACASNRTIARTSGDDYDEMTTPGGMTVDSQGNVMTVAQWQASRKFNAK